MKCYFKNEKRHFFEGSISFICQILTSNVSHVENAALHLR